MKPPHAGLTSALLGVAVNADAPRETRLSAMAAVPDGLRNVSDADFRFLLAGLQGENPVPLRSAAADALSKAHLSATQLEQLTDAVRTVGPLELHRLLAPFERSTDDALGVRLVAALREAAALPSLRVDAVRQHLGKYGPAVQQQIDELHALVNVDLATQRRRIEELLPRVASGDVRRGQTVFNNTKSACIVCHKFGHLGGNVGPDLTRIGQVRTERDLLESILYPSLSFVRSYEPVVIATSDGQVVSGQIRNETADELVLATGPNQEARVLRADIDEVRPGTVSVMPAGLDKQLTEQELVDLAAFLKNAK
jgi:putative heme-binding domain-containing protein